MLPTLLADSARRHGHLCPRQVLGVRMGLVAGEWLGLALPQTDKRLFTFVETDGCYADGISVATGCWLGRRTLRLCDQGKVAATFVDTATGAAVRIAPHPAARARAAAWVPDAPSRRHAQLLAYRQMPAVDLLCAARVTLTLDLAALISRPGLRVACTVCHEEILNAREVVREGRVFCRGCAGMAGYYIHAAPRTGPG